MRKLFLTIVLVCISILTFAQIDLYTIRGITQINKAEAFERAEGSIFINYVNDVVSINVFKQNDQRLSTVMDIKSSRQNYDNINKLLTESITGGKGERIFIRRNPKSNIVWFDVIIDKVKYRLLCVYEGDQSSGL